MSKKLLVFGKEIIDDAAIEQIKNCVTSEEDIAVLTADAHYGYSHPIGGAVAYKDKISLSGVGFDIGCGNMAVRTDVKVEDLNVSKVMDEVFKQISFGVGRNNDEKIDHPVLDEIEHSSFAPQRKMIQSAANQLGTVGSGNHFVDLFQDKDGFVWIGVHFGSRGFGHKTTTGFIAMSQGLEFKDKAHEGSMDSPPILFDANSTLGQDYFEAMNMAGKYAHAGREIVVGKVLEILGNPTVNFSVHNHHNFAWKENHFGEDYYVVRKGCTPAFPGQMGFIGANMSDMSVIVEGVESDLSKAALYSTVHGAGRILSRSKATGKRRIRKSWKCLDYRNCDGSLPIDTTMPKDGSNPKCPKCGHKTVKARWEDIISQGLVDFEAVKATMADRKIELRGAGADEAPMCYKKLDEVLTYQGDTIKVIHQLFPIGVAMAGADVYDPFKD